jgi:hypothetical protein
MRFHARCSGGHRFVLDTDTVADLTFRCEGYSDSLLGEASKVR